MASFAAEVESGVFGEGTEEVAQVFVLRVGPEALETPQFSQCHPHIFACLPFLSAHQLSEQSVSSRAICLSIRQHRGLARKEIRLSYLRWLNWQRERVHMALR